MTDVENATASPSVGDRPTTISLIHDTLASRPDPEVCRASYDALRARDGTPDADEQVRLIHAQRWLLAMVPYCRFPGSIVGDPLSLNERAVQAADAMEAAVFEIRELLAWGDSSNGGSGALAEENRQLKSELGRLWTESEWLSGLVNLMGDQRDALLVAVAGMDEPEGQYDAARRKLREVVRKVNGGDGDKGTGGRATDTNEGVTP